MSQFLLHHRHRPEECAAAAAAWRGFASPLRGAPAFSTCLFGGHEVWWWAEAASDEAALAQLPDYVAARSDCQRVREIATP